MCIRSALIGIHNETNSFPIFGDKILEHLYINRRPMPYHFCKIYNFKFLVSLHFNSSLEFWLKLGDALSRKQMLLRARG